MTANFSTRLNKVINDEGRTVASVARGANVQYRTLMRYLSADKPFKPTYEFAVALAHELGVHVDWLLTGKGEMHLPQVAKKHRGAANRGVSYEELIEQAQRSESYIFLPKREVAASAGGGANVEEESTVDWFAFKSAWAKSRGLSEDNAVLISVMGDSMAPKFMPGDTVLVDLTDKRLTEGAVYVIRPDSGLLIKRIRRKKGGQIILMSDNPTYDPEIYSQNELDEGRTVGRVRWRAGENF